MSSRPPKRRKPRPRPRPPGAHRSPWVYVAPAALLGAVTVIVMISSSAGWIGHTADGGPPASTVPEGTVQTLSVPDTAPPPATTQPPPPATTAATTHAATTHATTTASTTTASTTASTTTASTTASTTGSTTSATDTNDTDTNDTSTASDGSQHVKWTVKAGDTLSSIATQFGTSVNELERLNPDVDPATLQVGQTLVVR